MTESQPRHELSEQFVTDLVYFNFIRLAQTYGLAPEKLRVGSEHLRLDTKTLTVQIPSEVPGQEYPDVLSGIDYGTGNNVIEIFYQKGEESAKIYITKGVKSQKTKMHSIKVFDKIPTENNRNAYTFRLADEAKTKPNVYTVYDLLKKAETVLKAEEEKGIMGRITPKPTVGQRLSRRVKNLLSSE